MLYRFDSFELCKVCMYILVIETIVVTCSNFEENKLDLNLITLFRFVAT